MCNLTKNLPSCTQNIRISKNFNQIPNLRIEIHVFYSSFLQIYLWKNDQKSKLSKYLREFGSNLTRHFQNPFENVKNTRKTSPKYLLFIICSTKLAFEEFQKLKTRQICT